MITLDNIAMVIAVLGIIALSLWPLETHSIPENHENSVYKDEITN